jgi:hypothetical protein
MAAISFILLSLLSLLSKASHSTVDGAPPPPSVHRNILPVANADVKVLQSCFANILVAEFWSADRPDATHKFAIQDLLWQPFLTHSAYVT